MSMQDYSDGLKAAYEQPGAIADYEASLAPNHREDAIRLHEQYKTAKAQMADVADRYQAAKSSLDHRVEALERQWAEENAELLKEHEEATASVKQKESELRSTIILAYDANPTSKTIATGLSVRVTKKPVYDKEAALRWALKHQLALTLDAKAFEKVIEWGGSDLDFVEYQETISAVIGK